MGQWRRRLPLPRGGGGGRCSGRRRCCGAGGVRPVPGGVRPTGWAVVHPTPLHLPGLLAAASQRHSSHGRWRREPAGRGAGFRFLHWPMRGGAHGWLARPPCVCVVVGGPGGASRPRPVEGVLAGSSGVASQWAHGGGHASLGPMTGRRCCALVGAAADGAFLFPEAFGDVRPRGIGVALHLSSWIPRCEALPVHTRTK